MDEAKSVSYIVIHDLTPDANMVYLSPSLTEVLGYEPSELLGTSSFDWIHPEEVDAARKLHYETIFYEKAATLAYLRIRSQDEGWVHCVMQRSIVYKYLIGSVSIANPGAKALHTAATAQEVTFLTPQVSHKQLEFRKWNDCISPSPIANHVPRLVWEDLFDQCTIMLCTNSCMLPAASIENRSFYDIVSPRDEANVRSWVEASKSWGISHSGYPSDGGFVFGSFELFFEGRNGTERDSVPIRTRRETPSSIGTAGRSHQTGNDLAVDAIFSAHSDGFIVILRKAGG